MTIDTAAARSFLAGHGRVLDRRRLELLVGDGDVEGVTAAVDAYRNGDGGYGWGIEPDLRSPESQPVAAMHALEVLAEVAAAASPSPRGAELCDWLDAHTLDDGGLPLTLPIISPVACAPPWLGGDHTTSSLQMTAQVAANAQLVARHDARVAQHPWLARATTWCYETIARIDTAPVAHELMFAFRFLDVVAETDADAMRLLDRLAGFVPPGGVVPVAGGSPDEALRLLDLAPRRDGAARRCFSPDLVTAELDRLAAGQQPDGGWAVDFASASPAGALEWRGYATVNAVKVLWPVAGDTVAG
jgi:hypothetical protein